MASSSSASRPTATAPALPDPRPSMHNTDEHRDHTQPIGLNNMLPKWFERLAVAGNAQRQTGQHGGECQFGSGGTTPMSPPTLNVAEDADASHHHAVALPKFRLNFGRVPAEGSGVADGAKTADYTFSSPPTNDDGFFTFSRMPDSTDNPNQGGPLQLPPELQPRRGSGVVLEAMAPSAVELASASVADLPRPELKEKVSEAIALEDFPVATEASLRALEKLTTGAEGGQSRPEAVEDVFDLELDSGPPSSPTDEPRPDRLDLDGSSRGSHASSASSSALTSPLVLHALDDEQPRPPGRLAARLAAKMTDNWFFRNDDSNVEDDVRGRLGEMSGQQQQQQQQQLEKSEQKKKMKEMNLWAPQVL